MKPAQRAAAGAAALLATGLVGVGTASTASATTCSAQADRITSAQQLKASIAQAVATEKQAGTAGLSSLPQGGWPPPPPPGSGAA
ncbi:MAG: hypothetical protein ABI140_04110 [Jatrophihabitantaceae bacterium]